MHIYEKLKSQVSQVSINANRNQNLYSQSGLAVFSDCLDGFQGPLSGMLTGLKSAKTDFVLFVPCDSPYFPDNLLEKLKSAVEKEQVLIAYATDLTREHPTFCLISTTLQGQLEQYLQTGERKLLKFMQKNRAVAVCFGKEANFTNINTMDKLQTLNLSSPKQS